MQEVFNDHVTEGNEDIFLLRIKKKDDALNKAKRNIEVELRTPKPPTPPPPTPPSPPKDISPKKEEEKPFVDVKPKKGKKALRGKNRKKKK